MASRKPRPALERAATGWSNRRLGNQLAENRIQVFVTVEVKSSMSSTVAASTRPVVSCDPLSDLILGSLADKRGTGRFREDLLQLAWRKVRAAFPRSPSDEYDVGHGAFGWDGLTRFDSLSE